MLKIACRGGFALRFKVVEVIQYLFPVQFQRAALEMQRHSGQASTIIGQGALALAGKFGTAFEL